MNIVIKVGTQSILSSDGTPFEPIMLDLVEQIVMLKQAGHHVVLVRAYPKNTILLHESYTEIMDSQ